VRKLKDTLREPAPYTLVAGNGQSIGGRMLQTSDRNRFKGTSDADHRSSGYYRATGPGKEVSRGKLPLFRPEAVNQQSDKPYGEILLLRPLAISLLLWLAILFIVAVVVFLVVGRYTSKAHVSGILLPDQGLIKLYAPQAGILLACRVHEGQQVRSGEVVFEMTSDRGSLAFRSTETEIRNELLNRRQTLIQQLIDTTELGRQQQNYLRERIANVRQEQTQLASEVETTERKLTLTGQILDKYKQLRKADLISLLELEEKEREPLEQQKALAELRRSQVAAEKEVRDIQSQLQRAPLQTQLEIASFQRSIDEIEGQLTEHEASRAGVVRAPSDGTISAVTDKVGVMVQPSAALATLVPSQSKLEAHFYAPSRAIGFVKLGEKVVLHYQAYPSAQFGYHLGIISQIPQVALSPAEYASRTERTAQEPMYEIIVTLPAEVIVLHGQPHKLRAGMAVDGDILLDRRRLIEWIFEPLLNLRGELIP
jgi:membrane fusion protein